MTVYLLQLFDVITTDPLESLWMEREQKSNLTFYAQNAEKSSLMREWFGCVLPRYKTHANMWNSYNVYSEWKGCNTLIKVTQSRKWMSNRAEKEVASSPMFVEPVLIMRLQVN